MLPVEQQRHLVGHLALRQTVKPGDVNNTVHVSTIVIIVMNIFQSVGLFLYSHYLPGTCNNYYRGSCRWTLSNTNIYIFYKIPHMSICASSSSGLKKEKKPPLPAYEVMKNTSNKTLKFCESKKQNSLTCIDNKTVRNVIAAALQREIWQHYLLLFNKLIIYITIKLFWHVYKYSYLEDHLPPPPTPTTKINSDNYFITCNTGLYFSKIILTYMPS